MPLRREGWAAVVDFFAVRGMAAPASMVFIFWLFILLNKRNDVLCGGSTRFGLGHWFRSESVSGFVGFEGPVCYFSIFMVIIARVIIIFQLFITSRSASQNLYDRYLGI